MSPWPRAWLILPAIMAQLAAEQSRPHVFGTSQSATITTFEMRYLQSCQHRPGLDSVLYVDPAIPTSKRWHSYAFGFSIPQLGFTLWRDAATPIPSITRSVRPASTFPKYRWNVFATTNVIAGILFHPLRVDCRPITSGVDFSGVLADVLTTPSPAAQPRSALLVPFSVKPAADLSASAGARRVGL